MKTVLIIANRTFALSNSRFGIIKKLVGSGVQVVVLASKDSYSLELEKLGVVIVDAFFYRGGAAVLKELKSLWLIFRIIKIYSPVMVCSFNAKPVIYSGILLRLFFTGIKSVSVITGLGHAFIHGNFLKKIAGLGYKFALKRSGNHTVFQNRDDRLLFTENNWVNESDTSLVVGSGVDVKRFSRGVENNTAVKTVVMIGRLLNQKGVLEFIGAAERVKKTYVGEVRFLLLGEKDEVHPDAVDFSLVENSVRSGSIEYIGFKKDIVPYLRCADVFVLPSYREGVPRTVLEAASCGVPCVGADVPGTRECIKDGVTGFLVEVKSASALADKIHILLSDETRWDEMSQEARNFMEKDFDIESITERYLRLFAKVGGVVVSE